ncbi:unnamed protein product [Nippostrongylus brasiliensis]|uniref:NEDD8-activating enzyme E1 regulatory subunit (inferred by orthology to a C. elegans protein) n=1 Tax=Nippostrongylus brasiliensis TaxID=27835 RepID=A0A0N4YR40_NIPBR|nr:unnamed protein product [Nippostrongylus brasiliensis]
MDEVRYDRQLRLWGEEGQSSIARTSVCVLGSSALGTEIVKSLVLAGIHSELNSAVVGHSLLLSPTDLSDDDLSLMLQFFVVVGTNLPEDVTTRISSFLFERGVPFISARIRDASRAYGLLGYIRIFVQEHTIANNHEENALPDLRLDQPFPELQKMADQTDIDSMSLDELRHTPYILLYLIALKRYKEITGDANAFPDTYAKRKQFLEILWKMRREAESGSFDAENFNEAKAALARSLHTTKDLLSSIASSSEDEGSVSLAVWFLLLRAADKFHREKGRYPGTNGVPCTIDAVDLKQRVVSIISSSKLCGRIFCSGITAQEVIKLATNQYVPLDNTFVYDGHTQQSTVFRM